MSIDTDFRVHPDSTVDKPLDETVVPDTGLAGDWTQPIYECALCGAWSMDHRLFVVVVVGNGPAHQCKDFGRCQRTQARRAGRAS